MATFQIPRIAIQVKLNPEVKPPALYSLFKVDGNTWKCVRTTAFPWDFAIKVFRESVLDDPYRLRVMVVQADTKAQGISRFSGPKSELAGIRRNAPKIRDDSRNRLCD